MSDDGLETLEYKPKTYEPDAQSYKSHFSHFEVAERSQEHEGESTCELCIPINDKHSGVERPAALLFIIGGSDKYMPNETIKNQLKSGLFEIIKTTSIWIITQGKDTAVGNIVEEAILENRGTYEIRVIHRDKNQRREKDTLKEKNQHYLEKCIKSRPITPLIVIVVGGDAKSLSLAMSFLKRNDPVLAIDGSGCAADFICQGYAMSMHKIKKRSIFLYK